MTPRRRSPGAAAIARASATMRGIACRQAAAVLAAVDLDQKRERDVALGREARRGRNDIRRVRHQDQVGAGLLDARRMRELVRHDCRRIEDVAIARAREVLGLLQRRDRDAERRATGRDARDIDGLRGLQMRAAARRRAWRSVRASRRNCARGGRDRARGAASRARARSSFRSTASRRAPAAAAARFPRSPAWRHRCAGSPMRLCQ